MSDESIKEMANTDQQRISELIYPQQTLQGLILDSQEINGNDIIIEEELDLELMNDIRIKPKENDRIMQQQNEEQCKDILEVEAKSMNAIFEVTSLERSNKEGMLQLSEQFFLRNFIFDERLIKSTIPHVQFINPNENIMVIRRYHSEQWHSYFVCDRGVLDSHHRPGKRNSKKILFGSARNNEKKRHFGNDPDSSEDLFKPCAHHKMDITLEEEFSTKHCSITYTHTLSKKINSPFMLILAKYKKDTNSVFYSLNKHILKHIYSFLHADRTPLIQDQGSLQGTFIDLPMRKKIFLREDDFFVNETNQNGLVFLHAFVGVLDALNYSQNFISQSNQSHSLSQSQESGILFSDIQIWIVYNAKKYLLEQLKEEFGLEMFSQPSFSLMNTCVFAKFYVSELPQSIQNPPYHIYNIVIFIKDSLLKVSVSLLSSDLNFHLTHIEIQQSLTNYLKFQSQTIQSSQQHISLNQIINPSFSSQINNSFISQDGLISSLNSMTEQTSQQNQKIDFFIDYDIQFNRWMIQKVNRNIFIWKCINKFKYNSYSFEKSPLLPLRPNSWIKIGSDIFQISYDPSPMHNYLSILRVEYLNHAMKFHDRII